jgi:ribosomal-protein-alanine N-acetyltransferase
MPTLIRRARADDARGIHDAHMLSILEICGPDHNEEQLTAWGRRPYNEAIRIRGIEKDFIWVIEQDKKIEGFAHLGLTPRDHEQSGHLWGLYITPTVVRKGLGAALFAEVVKQAKLLGLKRFDFSSTTTSHKFYERMGCRNLPGTGIHLIGGKVPIPALAMEYWVDGAPPLVTIKEVGHSANDLVMEATFNMASIAKLRLHKESSAEAPPPLTHLEVTFHTSTLLPEVVSEVFRLVQMVPRVRDARWVAVQVKLTDAKMQHALSSVGALQAKQITSPDSSSVTYFINTTSVPRIETNRLTLSRFHQKDAPDVFAYASNPNVARTVTWPEHKTLEDTFGYFEFISKRLLESPDRSAFTWAMRLKDQGKAVGSIGFSRSGICGHLDYALSEHLWNQGLTTEAAKAVIAWAFARYPQLQRIDSVHRLENTPSGKVMLKAGMQFEGIIRQSVMVKGFCIDLAQYSITRHDYSLPHVPHN